MINSKVILITSIGEDGGVKIYKITIPNSNSLSRQDFHFSANNPYTVTEGQDSDTITLKNPTFNFSLTSKFTPGKIVINGVNTNQDSVINYPIMRNTTVTATAVTIDKNNFPLNYYARDCIDNYASIPSLSNNTITELTDITPMPDASYAFSGCSNLTTLNDVYTTWDMSNVTDISYMFNGCSSLEELDLSDWDLSKVTTSTGFSNGCSSLTELKLSGTISNSTLSNITSGLKTNTSSPFYLDLSEATLSISETQFKDYTGLKEIDIGPNVTLANNGATQQIFDNCQNIERIDVTKLNVSNAQYLRCMFRNLKKLTSLDLSTWDTKNVRYFSSSSNDGMFSNSTALKVLDISNFDSNTNVGYSYYYIWGTFYNTPAMEYLILGSPIYKFRTQHNHECGNLNTTCKILVPGNLLNTYKHIDRWNQRPGQFYPIENYTITRSRGQVSVTPKVLTEIDLSDYNTYTINFFCDYSVISNYLYIQIELSQSENYLNSMPFFFINITDNGTNNSYSYVLAELIDANSGIYRAKLDFNLDDNSSYEIEIPSQEVPNFKIIGYGPSIVIGIEKRVNSQVTVSTEPIFGVEFTKSTNTWKRIDASGVETNVQPSDYETGSVIGNIPYEFESTTIDGCSMVKIPKFYYIYQTTSDGHRWWISSEEFAIGYLKSKVHPAFIHNGVEKDYFYIGAYEASIDPNDNTKLCSRNGVTPLGNKTILQFREMAQARNVNGVTGFDLWNIYQLGAIQLLALIYLGNPNVQSLIGNGNSSGSSMASCGSTNAVWKGIYELWGNGWTKVLGLKTSAYNYLLWTDTGNENFETLNGECIHGSTSKYTGDISKVGAEKGLFLAISTGSSSSNIYNDYSIGNREVDRVADHGGRPGDSDGAGLFAMQIVESTTYSNNLHNARLAKY